MKVGSTPAADRAIGEHAHRVGIVTNFVLALVKVGGGMLTGSHALYADGVHSFGDLATNGVAWLSFRVAAMPPDEDHHYGHGKAEAAAGLFVGTLLAGIGLAVLWDAVGEGGPQYEGVEAAIVLGIAVLSIVANEWLTRVTLHAADRLRSQALRALARDNRSDSLSSVLVVIGVGGGYFGLGWAEPFATAGIGAFVVLMGWKSLKDGLDVLMDRVPDPDMRSRIAERARRVPGVVGVQHTRVHPLGSDYRVDMEISVDGGLSVREGHAIAHAVERAVRAPENSIVQVSVHVNPAPQPEPPA